MIRLLVLVLLLASLALGVVLASLGVPPPVAAPGAVFGAGLAATLLGIRQGQNGIPLTAGGIVFCALGLALISFDATHGYNWVTAAVVTAGVGVVELAVVFGLPAGRRLATRAGHGGDRRALARRMGFQHQASEPSVVARLGSMVTQVSRVEPRPGPQGSASRPFQWSHQRLSVRGPGRDVISGRVGDMPFTVFDFASGGRSKKPWLQTAWVVELPVHLPYLGLPFAYCWDGWGGPDPMLELATSFGMSRQLFAAREPSYYTESPEFAQDLLTPEVRKLTLEQLPSWWIDGQYLISAGGEPRGASSGAVVRNLDLMETLARLFPPSVLRRWAQRPQPPGSRSAAWLAGVQAQRAPR